MGFLLASMLNVINVEEYFATEILIKLYILLMLVQIVKSLLLLKKLNPTFFILVYFKE